MKSSKLLSTAACLLAGSVVPCLFHAGAVRADELPAIPVTPDHTKVLILPTLDQTGDRPDMQKEHVDFGNHRLEYEFLIRHFQVMGPAMAIHAARNEDFDITDDDSRTKSAMKKLGADTGADWVVSAAVIEVKSTNARLGNRRAQGKVKLRIFDMKQDGWIADRFFEDHKDSFGNVGTTGLFRAALDTTVQRSTANLLDSYPKIVKVDDQFGERDYLPGQTTAYLPDPATTFTGLSPTDPVAAPVSLPAVPAAAPDPAPATPAAPSPPTAPPTNELTATQGSFIVPTPAAPPVSLPAAPGPAPAVPPAKPMIPMVKPTPAAPKAPVYVPYVGSDVERQTEAAVLAHLGKKVDWHQYGVEQMQAMEDEIQAKKK